MIKLRGNIFGSDIILRSAIVMSTYVFYMMILILRKLNSKIFCVSTDLGVLNEAKRMMLVLEKTLQMDPKRKSFVPRNLQNGLGLGGFQDSIRQITRIRVANALRNKMAKNYNISTCNEKINHVSSE